MAETEGGQVPATTLLLPTAEGAIVQLFGKQVLEIVDQAPREQVENMEPGAEAVYPAPHITLHVWLLVTGRVQFCN